LLRRDLTNSQKLVKTQLLQIEELRYQIEDFEELQTASGETEVLQSQIAALESQNTALSRSQKAVEKELALVECKVKDFFKREAQMMQQIHDLKQQNSEMESEFGNFSKKLGLYKHLEQLASMPCDLIVQISGSCASDADYKCALQKYHESNQKLTAEVADYKQKCMAAMDGKRQAKAQISELLETKKKQATAIDMLKNRLNSHVCFSDENESSRKRAMELDGKDKLAKSAREGKSSPVTSIGTFYKSRRSNGEHQPSKLAVSDGLGQSKVRFPKTAPLTPMMNNWLRKQPIE
jgi:chromosome segregation ATPase